MANHILFLSSWYSGIIHIFAITKHIKSYENPNILLCTMYIVGVITSIVNHGTTSELSKWADRIVMVVAFCADAVWTAHSIECTHYLMYTVGFFFIAKYFQAYEYRYPKLYYAQTGIHLLSHITITLYHMRTLQQLPYV